MWIWDAIYRGFEPQPCPYCTTITLGLRPTYNCQKIHPHPHLRPHVAYQCTITPMICPATTYMMWMWDAVLWSFNHDITTSRGLSPTPNFQNPPSPQVVYQRKGVPTCPSPPYQSANVLYVYMMWMWVGAVYSNFEPQPCSCSFNITWSQPYSKLSKNPPSPQVAYKPICPAPYGSYTLKPPPWESK